MAKMVLTEERTKPLKNLTLEDIDTDEAAQNITVAQAIRHYLEQIGVAHLLDPICFICHLHSVALPFAILIPSLPYQLRL